MLPTENIEILVNDLTTPNEQVLAEKLGEVLAIVLPKLVRRKMEKILKNEESHK